ncbi:MAG: hypothetical protein IH608_07725, partial [Proteobacteria bacterium]|nr:hypothetical protein [Pseudomonadota bacterium]
MSADASPLHLPKDLLGRLDRLGPGMRAIVEAAWPDTCVALAPQGVSAWLSGVEALLGAGAGPAVLVTYIRSALAVARSGAEEILPRIADVGLAVLRRADAQTLDAFLDSLPRVALRLRPAAELPIYLELVEELSGLAPRALVPLFEQVGQL